MTHPWEKDLYKPLNMANIQGYPNTMPKEVKKWLQKFPINNVITVEDHLYVMGRDMENAGIEHEDVAMKLFSSSLTKESLDWFRGLPENHLTSDESFSNSFKNKWSTKEDGGTLGEQFNQINKKGNEMVREFNTGFDKLYNQIPTYFCPATSSIRLLYMDSFEG
jgi:hypothetical protein